MHAQFVLEKDTKLWQIGVRIHHWDQRVLSVNLHAPVIVAFYDLHLQIIARG